MARDRGELLTADIVCYGTPSPGALQCYFGMLESGAGKGLKSYAHRGHGIPTGGSAYAEYADGSREEGTPRVAAWNRVWYGRLLRESCFRCGYHSVERPGDVTIGDYWGIEEVAPGLDDRWGVSCLLANSRRGLELVSSVSGSLELMRTTVAQAANPSQPMLDRPPSRGEREGFWDAMYIGGFAAGCRAVGALGVGRAVRDAVRSALSRFKASSDEGVPGPPRDDERFGVDFGRLLREGEYPVAFAARNRDESVRRESSSGGMFHALASHVIGDLDGVVYGCAFDGDLRARHVRCETIEEAERCMGSKYSQSDMGDAIARVREDLDEGRVVLFTGTPCQVAAVRSACGDGAGGRL